MRVLKCVFTNTEFYGYDNPPAQIKGSNGVPILYEVTSRMLEKKDDCGIAANADEDAEEGAEAEALDSGVAKVNDVIDGYNLRQVDWLDKKAYGAHLKAFLKKTMERKFGEGTEGPEVDAWKAASGEVIKGLVLGDFENCEFYTTADLFDAGTTDDSQYIVAKWKEGADAPCFYFWMDAVREEKY